MKLKVDKFDATGLTVIEFVAESDAEDVILGHVARAVWDEKVEVKVHGKTLSMCRTVLAVSVVPKEPTRIIPPPEYPPPHQKAKPSKRGK